MKNYYFLLVADLMKKEKEERHILKLQTHKRLSIHVFIISTSQAKIEKCQ